MDHVTEKPCGGFETSTKFCDHVIGVWVLWGIDNPPHGLPMFVLVCPPAKSSSALVFLHIINYRDDMQPKKTSGNGSRDGA